jgi:hypothetical protein
MLLPFPLSQSKVYPKIFKASGVGDRDHRGEQIRVRLSEEDLIKVTTIQEFYDSVGIPSSIQRVLSDAIGTHYSVLASQGSVEPHQ